MKEAGFGDVATSSWFGLMAPAGTPREVIDLLNAKVNAVLARGSVKARYAQLGLTPTGGRPAQYAAFLEGNVDFWKRAVSLTGTRLE
jgi:tripartite-type tricarboxylate transporter receptor subunit TctC